MIQQKLLHTDAFTHRSFYTQTFLHTKSFYTRTLLHTEAFTHRHFYTQTLLHTGAFTHRSVFTQTILHTETFTHRRFYTQTSRRFYTDAFTQMLFTHRSFDTQHTEALYTQKKSQFYLSFWRSNRISCETVAPDDLQIAILPQFLTIEQRVAPDDLQIAILPQFLTIEPHFVQKGCAGRLANRNFTTVFGDRTSFRAKGLRRTTFKSQFYRSFWRSNLISCETVAPDDLQIAILPQFLAIEPHFVRKGCVSCRLVGTAPAPAFKREIEKKEKARGQEGKRRRCEMRRCEDEKM